VNKKRDDRDSIFSTAVSTTVDNILNSPHSILESARSNMEMTDTEKVWNNMPSNLQREDLIENNFDLSMVFLPPTSLQLAPELNQNDRRSINIPVFKNIASPLTEEFNLEVDETWNLSNLSKERIMLSFDRFDKFQVSSTSRLNSSVKGLAIFLKTEC